MLYLRKRISLEDEYFKSTLHFSIFVININAVLDSQSLSTVFSTVGCLEKITAKHNIITQWSPVRCWPYLMSVANNFAFLSLAIAPIISWRRTLPTERMFSVNIYKYRRDSRISSWSVVTIFSLWIISVHSMNSLKPRGRLHCGT